MPEAGQYDDFEKWAAHSPQPDLIIAATADHHGLTILSRDTGDYAKARVNVLKP